MLKRAKNRTIFRLAVAVLASGGLWLAYSQFGQTAAKLDLVKVKDDLYVIHNDFVPGNSTALITNEGVILVDDKFEIDHDNVMAQIKKVTNQPVKYVINTHHHSDHSGSNAKMQSHGAIAVSSERARQNMVDGKQPGLPTVTFEREANIWLGGKQAKLYYFGRAHTDGDIVVLFPADRVLAAGDIFTIGDATPELIDYSGGGSAKDWTRTLDGALALDFDTAVPGHGVVGTKREMQKFRDSTLSLRNKVHDMIVAKRSRADVEKMLRNEFHWADLHVQMGLDGAMQELR
jgi:glyoxylase-like metal-dependent hydrolase (beta-lactamase superfamily II)